MQENYNNKNKEKKTQEEVNKISKEKFDNLDVRQIENLLWAMFNLGSWNTYGIISADSMKLESGAGSVTMAGTNVFDIQNVVFNKENSTISFDVIEAMSELLKFNKPNLGVSIVGSKKYKFENIKIESSTYITNNNNILPTIKFSEVQDNNASFKLEDFYLEINHNQKNEFINYNYENIKEPKPNKDDFVKEGYEMLDYDTKYKKVFEKLKEHGTKLGTGTSGDKLVLKNNFYGAISEDSLRNITNFGHYYDYDNKKVVFTELTMENPIFYSTINNDNISWEVYEQIKATNK